MSLLKATKSIRFWERSLISGYFMTNCDKIIPSEIIQLCILYCFILDEFDSTNNNTHSKIYGLNNTITDCEVIESNPIHIYSRNTHQPTGIYHWTFKISHSVTTILSFGFMQNNECIGTHQISLWTWSFLIRQSERIYHVYLDTINNVSAFTFESGDIGKYTTEDLKKLDNMNPFKLYITVLKGKATIEMTNFRNSNWYTTQLLHNKTDPIANVGYAQCLYDIKQRIKHYSIALNGFPDVELWNGQYLSCLMTLNEYDKAYEHAIIYQKGQYEINQLSERYFFQHEYAKSYELFQLINIKEIDKDGSLCNSAYQRMANCCRKLKKLKEAIKYFKLHIEYNPNDVNVHNLISCVYDDCKEFDDGRKWALKALDLAKTDNDKNRMLTNIGVNAYYQGNIKDAIKYTEQAITYIATTEGGLDKSNLGKYYYKLKKYEESEYYLCEAIKLNSNHADINGNYGILMYYLNRKDEAIIHLKKCLMKIDIVQDRELVMDVLYVYGMMLYDKGMYKESIIKCMEAITGGDFNDYKQKDLICYLLSKNYEKTGEIQKKRRYLIKAQQFNPNNSMYQDEINKMHNI
eukprot:362912_1